MTRFIINYRYHSQSDLQTSNEPTEESLLKQVEMSYMQEEIDKYLLDDVDVNNISFILNEAKQLNDTFTIPNFQELESAIESKFLQYINRFYYYYTLDFQHVLLTFIKIFIKLFTSFTY